MTLGKREKILAGVVGALVVVFAGQFLIGLLSGDDESAGDLRIQRDELRRRIDQHQQAVDRAAASMARLAQWQQDSLPSRPDAARSRYQAWLRGAVERIGFRGSDVFSGEGQKRGDAYTLFPFQVQGEASLDQLVQFLHEFYSAPHLHKIRRMTIHPGDGGERLTLAISIEALSLPGADRADTLAEGRSGRLQFDALEEYRRRINRRLMEGERYVEKGGVFMAYSPPPKPPAPPARVDPPPPPPVLQPLAPR